MRSDVLGEFLLLVATWVERLAVTVGGYQTNRSYLREHTFISFDRHDDRDEVQENVQ